ncbi:MAG: DUF2934 domain-containing protein [Methylophilales bacterium]|nr:DUF2934 domain-containing protein [Methylophilales bacterium]
MAIAKPVAKKPAAKPAEKAAAKPATKKVATKKPVAKKAVAKKPAAPVSKKVVAAPGAEERYKMVEVAAYYIAERNGFVGDPSAFWAEAEMQISKLLKF